MSKILKDQGARQGPKGKPILLVLVGSFLLIGIYLLSMLVWSGSNSPDSPSQDASRRQTTSPSSSSNASQTPPANPAYPAPASPTATGSTGTTGR
jgi:cytoskeletal protein RodZ